MDIGELVVSAAASAATLLEGSEGAKEADLKTELRAAIEDGSARFDPGSSEWNPRLEGWPKVGGIDIAVFEHGEAELPVAAIELKWGAKTLYNTIWDALKVATVVRERGVRSFLVAGAPVAEWSTAVDGVEVFQDGEIDTADLIERHQSLWAFWRGEVDTRPRCVPAAFSTRLLGEQLTTCDDTPFSVRVAEVRLPNGERTLALDVDGVIRIC